MEKRSHLGMAGHYAAMAEFLYRGYNVAIPSVDTGDDVIVIEDGDGVMWRLQVKTADAGFEERRGADGTLIATGSYTLSRKQLRDVKENELFFMFVVRWGRRWRFILIDRKRLELLRDEFEARDRTGTRGRRPVKDERAKADALALRIVWTRDEAVGWGASFAAYLDRWPEEFPERAKGPGAVGR